MEPLSSGDEHKVIAKAKRRWILLGILGFGLTMFVTTTAFDYYQRPGLFFFDTRGFYRILFDLALWLTLGYFWGLGMSKYFCKRLRK